MSGWFILVALLAAVFWPLMRDKPLPRGDYLGDRFDGWGQR